MLDEAGQVLCRVVRPDADGGPVGVVVSPDGTRLACLTGEGGTQLSVFDATSGKLTAICKRRLAGVWTYAFSPDGTRLTSGSEDGTACVWEAATGNLLATCRGHTSTVQSATFSPDGTRLLTASADGTVRQWDARTGQLLEPPYDRHGVNLYSAVYSPDGQWIASSGEDRTIRVWRSRDRQDVAVLHGHTGTVCEVAFAPGGRRLASRSIRFGPITRWDDSVRVWDVDPDATLPVLRGHTKARLPGGLEPGRPLAGLGELGQNCALVGRGDRRALRDLVPPFLRIRVGLRARWNLAGDGLPVG